MKWWQWLLVGPSALVVAAWFLYWWWLPADLTPFDALHDLWFVRYYRG